MRLVTRVSLLLLAGFAAFGLASCAGKGPIITKTAGKQGIILYNCAIIDGTGNEPQQDGVIIIQGGRIIEAGRKIPLPSGEYTRIDLRGAYVLPGFINAHVHQAYNKENLRNWLLAGITTVRDMSPFRPDGYLKARDEFNADPRCSRVVSSCPMITAPGGYGSLPVASPEEARAITLKWIDQGADFIKIAIEDDLQARTWHMLQPEEVRSVVDAAHFRGVRVSVHLSHARNLTAAIDARVDDIAHMVVEPLDGETAKRIVDAGILWTPTLELWQGVSKMHGLDWASVAIQNVSTFYKAGGKIALGTDFAGYTCAFDKGFPKAEVSLMKKAGMSNMDIIMAATVNAARACGMEDRIGSIAPGKVADLLVVRSNPLQDIDCLQKPAMVVHNGVIVE